MAPILSTIHCDNPPQTSITAKTASAIQTVKTAMAVPESELKRWKRIFEANAQTVVGEEK